MRNEDREATANWSILIGAVLLFVSLFLTWSHQFPPDLPAILGRGALGGVPANPDAWQVYSAADILLCLLAVTLAAAAVAGSHAARQVAAVATALAMAFVAHALANPPTNGLVISDPGQGLPAYGSTATGPGAGEILAIIALTLALAGLLLSLSVDRTASEPAGHPAS